MEDQNIHSTIYTLQNINAYPAIANIKHGKEFLFVDMSLIRSVLGRKIMVRQKRPLALLDALGFNILLQQGIKAEKHTLLSLHIKV